MAASWFFSQRGQRRGPYPAEVLQQMVDRGEIDPEDLVWCEGMADWVPARTVIKPSDYRAPREQPRRSRYDGDPEEGGRHDRDRYDRDRHERPYGPGRRAEVPSVEGPTGPPSQFPGRLITPAFFLLALLLFFCPWVDVHRAFDGSAQQSGLQLCFGGFSNSSWGMFNPRPVGRLPQDDKISAAPLVIGFGVLVLAGFILGLALPTGTARVLLTGLPALVAFLVLVVQVSVGFPIQANVDRVNNDVGRVEPFAPGAPFPINPFDPFGANHFRVSTTPWFWLTIVLILCVGAGLLIEHLAIFRSRRAPARFADNELEDFQG